MQKKLWTHCIQATDNMAAVSLRVTSTPPDPNQARIFKASTPPKGMAAKVMPTNCCRPNEEWQLNGNESSATTIKSSSIIGVC